MDCISIKKTPEKEKEFLEAVIPAVKWLRKNCCLKNKITIEADKVKMECGEMEFPLEKEI